MRFSIPLPPQQQRASATGCGVFISVANRPAYSSDERRVCPLHIELTLYKIGLAFAGFGDVRKLSETAPCRNGCIGCCPYPRIDEIPGCRGGAIQRDSRRAPRIRHGAVWAFA